MSLRPLLHGLEGSGCDVEYTVVRETEKAYLLDDQTGFQFWLPKSCVRDDGEITRFGLTIIEQKYRTNKSG